MIALMNSTLVPQAEILIFQNGVKEPAQPCLRAWKTSLRAIQRGNS